MSLLSLLLLELPGGCNTSPEAVMPETGTFAPCVPSYSLWGPVLTAGRAHRAFLPRVSPENMPCWTWAVRVAGTGQRLSLSPPGL